MGKLNKELYLISYIKVVTEENKQLKRDSKKYKRLGSKHQSVIDYKLHLNSIRTTLLLQELYRLRYPGQVNPHEYKRSSSNSTSSFIELNNLAKLHI